MSARLQTMARSLGIPAGPLLFAWCMVALLAVLAAATFVSPELGRSILGRRFWGLCALVAVVTWVALLRGRGRSVGDSRAAQKAYRHWTVALWILTALSALNALSLERTGLWPLFMTADATAKQGDDGEAAAPQMAPGGASATGTRLTELAAATSTPASAAAASLGLDSRERLVAAAVRTAHAQDVQRLLEAAKGLEDKLKDIQESQNQWGTLFAWLLAVVAVVIAFVTSWILMLSREVKEQVQQAESALDLENRIETASQTLMAVTAQHELHYTRQALDPVAHHSAHKLISYLIAYLRLVGRAESSKCDTDQLWAELERKVLVCEQAFEVCRPTPRELKRCLQQDVIPILEARLQMLRRSTYMDDDSGRAIIRSLVRMIARCDVA